MKRLTSLIPGSLALPLRHLQAATADSMARSSKVQRRLVLRRILSIPSALICLWVFSIWWGEHLVYKRSLDSCRWEHWEQWVRFEEISMADVVH